MTIKNTPAASDRGYQFKITNLTGDVVYSGRLSPRLLKFIMAGLLIFIGLLGGAIVDYKQGVDAAQRNAAELNRLQEANSFQARQIEQLAKATQSLQEDMNRLNLLDAEIRHKSGEPEATNPSRGGSDRPDGQYNGQGGPEVRAELGDIATAVQALQGEVQQREASLNEILRSKLILSSERPAQVPAGWPCYGEVSSGFGWRNSPFGSGSDWHPGLDIANDYGTPVVATAEGEVTYTGWYSGYGNLVKISHANGVETLYGHNAQIVVAVGQRVRAGQLISYMGSTGLSTGPHVHYEIRINGTPVNPVNFL